MDAELIACHDCDLLQTSVPLPEGGAKGHVHRLGELLPEYYRERGWSEDGVPTDEKLAQLALTQGG